MTTPTIHTITPTDLDPITVIITEHGHGSATLIVHCYSCAWSAYWGSTGHDHLKDFLARVSASYVANVLIRGRRQWISSRKAEDRELAYLERICQAIVDAAKRGALE